MLDKIITYSFYALFSLTPLFWSAANYELFEFNKMLLVYGFTIIISGCWIFKMIQEKRMLLYRTPLDIPLLLFLAANIISAIFSIDIHTSIWGYYSRLNGGLLSLVSYLLLYFAFVANMNKETVKTCLKFALGAGIIVSVYAILEHFGVSPSCVILRGDFNASCWIQDVQARVFATLGQPNWLASYLSMLIFPAFYFLLTAKNKLTLTTYYLLLTTYYLAFTFTYSRGPTLGLIGGFIVFVATLLTNLKFEVLNLNSNFKFKIENYKRIASVLLIFLLINLLFGSALTSFRLVSRFTPPPRPSIGLPAGSGTQLENGGTESGQIRFIVWQGALEIFKAYPIFGSGLETFAYSYYQYRPIAHNLTSEWDFLYNKAHNEYLNYLATTGIIGFGTYLLLIGTFVFWCIKYYVLSIKQKNLTTYYLLLTTALLASYISYLIYNFFLFSVVIIAVFFYLFPALSFVISDSVKPLKLPKQLFTFHFSLFTFIYRRPIYTNLVKGFIIFLTIYSLFSIYKLWLADTLFNQAEHASEAGNPGKAYNLLLAASSLNSNEPFYRSELGYNGASAAVALAPADATTSAILKDEAATITEDVLKNNPKNTSFWRSAVRTYFELASLDSGFTDKTLTAVDTAISLAPTDPKLYYNKALILDSIDRKEEAVKALQKAIQLKPNYMEARQKLEEATAAAKP